MRSIPVSLAAAFTAASLLVAGAPAAADLLLNEVFYDPAGVDDGHEWAELWNAAPAAVSLAGVSLEAADGSRPDLWSVVYRGSATDSVPPRTAFLVSAAALAGALQNGPDAIRLVRDGVVLDLLGYGALDAPALFRSAPAADAASGHSLARRGDGVDTGSNANDWEDEPAPTPGRANHPDERIALVPGLLALDPVVSWPGETVRLRVRAVNRGRLPLASSRWRVVLDAADTPATTGSRGPLSAGSAAGVALAPGESAWVEVRLEAAAAGPFRGLVRATTADGSPSADLADSAEVTGRVIAGPAVVNEISFRDSGAGEWIELWFRDSIPDVGSLALADAASTPRAIARGDAPRPVSAGSLLVIAKDPAAVRERYGLDATAVLGVAGAWPSFNDTNGSTGFADVVRVFGSDSIPCDAVAYDARAAIRGGSLERLGPDLPGDLAGTFGECVDAARATPGRPNSLRAPDGDAAPRGALLVASGRVLRRTDASAPLLFRLTPEARGRTLVVQVFDLLGRRVRTLVAGQRFAAEGAFAWDGRDAAGAWAAPGLYVIAAESAAEKGLGPRRTSIPVAVSAAGIVP